MERERRTGVGVLLGVGDFKIVGEEAALLKGWGLVGVVGPLLSSSSSSQESELVRSTLAAREKLRSKEGMGENASVSVSNMRFGRIW